MGLADLIDEALDWPSQRANIYIRDATVEDWRAVVARVLDGGYQARLCRDGADVPMPAHFEPVFGGDHVMSLVVGDMVVSCYFFRPSEIELSFSRTT